MIRFEASWAARPERGNLPIIRELSVGMLQGCPDTLKDRPQPLIRDTALARSAQDLADRLHQRFN